MRWARLAAHHGCLHRNAGSERNVFTGAERASGESSRSDERRTCLGRKTLGLCVWLLRPHRII